MKNVFFLILISVVLFSCSKKIEPINYGNDACAFCSMTIVEHTHAAQLVTNKGKNFKFDATECMINYLHENANESDMLHILSTNYLNPGELIDAKDARFIISENIPSPMGFFLSAIASKEEAEELKAEQGGELYTWEEIKLKVAGNSHSSHGHH